jgi:hypothetical protein
MGKLEELQRQLERQGKTGRLAALAGSEDGKRLERQLDSALLQRAQQGDGGALRQLLTQVLASGEGQRLAAQVRQLMEK